MKIEKCEAEIIKGLQLISECSKDTNEENTFQVRSTVCTLKNAFVNIIVNCTGKTLLEYRLNKGG
jgi:hypothetical protein